MQLCGQRLLSRCPASSSSISSSSNLRRSLSRHLLSAPAPHRHHRRLNSRTQQQQPAAAAAAAAGQPQPEQRPEGSDDLGEQQQLQQQQIQELQQPLTERAEEAEASAAYLAATAADEAAATAAAESSQEEDEEVEDTIAPELLQQLQQQQQEWEQQHQQWCRTSRNLYLLLALGLTAAGGLVAIAAGPIAAAGLKLGAGLQAPTAAVLVGCFGAAVIRAASLAWFLAEGAALGELGSWRYQRINLGLAAVAAAAAAAGGWAGAHPWTLLPLLGGCAATAAACLAAAWGQARHEGFYFASALGYGDVFQGLAVTVGYLLYNVTCLAGAVMTGVTLACAGLGFAALSGPALLPQLPWLASGTGGGAAATLLHKLLGCGLLLTALQAWALTECATESREISHETGVKLLFVRNAEEVAFATGQLGPAPVHVPPRRFDLLHAGFIAAAVGQGLWLAQGSWGLGGPGVGLLNLSDPVWGSLFWSVMGTGVYLVVLLGRMDFADVWGRG